MNTEEEVVVAHVERIGLLCTDPLLAVGLGGLF